MSLSEKKAVWSTHEIQYEAQEAGFAQATVTRAISNLSQSGKLIKIKMGEYEIVS